MGIRKWSHRGREKLVLSKIWPDGTRFRRFMPNPTVAKQLETRIDFAVITGTWPEVKTQLMGRSSTRDDRSNPTIRGFVEEYLEYCKANNRRPDFKEQALTSIVRILGDVRLKELRRGDADRFKAARLGEGVSAATVNRGLAVLRHLFSLAVEREYVKANPLLGYRMLKEVQEPLRIMNYGQYRELIQAVAEEDLVIGAYSVILGETGMRKSEGLRGCTTRK